LSCLHPQGADKTKAAPGGAAKKPGMAGGGAPGIDTNTGKIHTHCIDQNNDLCKSVLHSALSVEGINSINPFF
jgi:hypothetical protein